MEQQQAAQQVDLSMYRTMDQFNPDSPENGVTYVSKEEYEALKAGGQQAAAAPADGGQQPQPAGSVDINEVLKEKTGGKFSSLEDVLKLTENTFSIPDEAKDIYDMLQKKDYESLGKFVEAQTLPARLEKMSDAEAIKLQMKLADPEADDEDIAYDFESKFAEPDYESMGDEDAKRAKKAYDRSLKKAASEARAAIKSQAKDFDLPALPQNQGKSQEDLANEVQSLAEFIHQSAKSKMADLSKLNFRAEDTQQGVDIPFDFNITNEDKTKLEGSLKNYFESFDNRYGQGDQFDGAKLAKDQFVIENIDKIVKSAILHGYNQGIINKAKELARVDLNTPDATAIVTAQQQEREKALAAMKR